MAGIPSRLAEIGRDLGAMALALRTRGGGGSASELRSDAGIFFQYGIEETLKRHVDLMTWENILVDQNVAVGQSTDAVFSFEEDVYVLAMEMWARGNPANLEGASLTVADPASASGQGIYLTTPAVEVIFSGFVIAMGFNALASYPNMLQNVLPLFVPAGSDFTFRVDADAVGSVRCDLTLTVARCPKGVEIPH